MNIILGALLVLAIGVILAILIASRKENINGVCSVICEDCTEKDWCIFRYKEVE
jgi:hypothetical protein